MDDEIILSICIPTYNRAEIVYGCVTACLSCIPNMGVEIVVNDNCSPDNTEKRLSEIKDARFSYYKNDCNIEYQNFAVALTKGKGKFCMLLSDEDELIKVNWDRLLRQLEKAQDTMVMQFKYYDTDRTLLVSRQKVLPTVVEKYKYILSSFGYAGGLIIRRDRLETVWNEIDKKGLLWTLYAHTLSVLYCAKLGKVGWLDTISVRRSINRDNKGFVNISAWNGNGEKPYWHPMSRVQQTQEWMQIIGRMDFTDEDKKELISYLYITNAYNIVRYKKSLEDKSMLNSPLYIKRRDIVRTDQKKKMKDWILMFWRNERMLDHTINAVLGEKADITWKLHNKYQVFIQFMKLIFDS